MAGFHLNITLKVVKTIRVGFESESPLKKIIKEYIYEDLLHSNEEPTRNLTTR